MNQILVTEKIYITPELKRKKKIYKFNFIISIALIVVLFSFYAYAEYDRNKNEDLSHDILAEMNNVEDTTTISQDDDIWVIALDGVDNNEDINENNQEGTPGVSNAETQQVLNNTYTASNGRQYTIVGSIKIPKINVDYPILAETTDS